MPGIVPAYYFKPRGGDSAQLTDSNELPNLGNQFWIAGSGSNTAGYDFWHDYEYEVLMPDITVYQTIEDYANGIDSVLKALLD